MEHIWKIYNLERIISDGMVTKVVYACESEGDGFGDRYINTTNLTTGSSSDANFITYENLTEDTVLGWITGSINQSDIELNLSSSIASRVIANAAITSSMGTPWD